jgi:uncharacterized protein (TIGR00106 family)
MDGKVVGELQIVVLGTGDTSMSTFVAIATKTLEERGIKHQITPMGTVVEGTLDEVLGCVSAVHEALVNNKALRIVTHLILDDRRDRPRGMEGKVASVKEKLAGSSK